MKFLDVPQSGSIAGNTHSHNRAGQYKRNRRAPVQPIGTGRRAFIRSAFSAASSAWAGLTFPDQAAWSSYADSHPVTDSLGQSIKLTGHQMFVAINTQNINSGQTMITAPPTTDVVDTLTGVTVNNVSDDVFEVNWAGQTVGNKVLIAVSPPLSSGRTFTNVFWQASVVATQPTDPVNIESAYTAQFGTPPVGSRVFVKVTPVNSQGVTGTPVIVLSTTQAS